MSQEIRQKKEETTGSSGELEIPQNSLDHRRRIPIPLELNCQIFECLKFGIQRKFIGGLGRGIYGMFRHKVLKKFKKLRNPEQNGWEVSNTAATISSNGLVASDDPENCPNVYAKKGFPITGELSRTDNFPGTILYYFEVTITLSSFAYILVGLSSGNIPNGTYVDSQPNSYAISCGSDYSWLSGDKHPFELPNGAIKPEWNVHGKGDVIGCGLVLNPANELSIFFTSNGILMGKQIPINSTVNTLYPTVSLFENVSAEANFGDDPAKPFKYDIKKCPVIGFE